jgi:hypothetical protein
VEETVAQKSVGVEFSPSFQTSLLSPAFRFDALEVIVSSVLCIVRM